jgi:hypothetical protein
MHPMGIAAQRKFGTCSAVSTAELGRAAHALISPASQRQSWIAGCDISTRRANHQKPVKPLLQKYSSFPKRQISA